MDGILKPFDKACKAWICFHFLLDALDGVDYCGMVLASEARTNALQADGGAFAHEEHGNLAGSGNFLGATTWLGELRFWNFVMNRNGMQYCIEAYAATKCRGYFRNDLLGDAHVDIVVHEACLEGKFDDGAFEAADVTGDVFGEEVDDFVADFQVAFFGLLLENGFAGFYVGRLDVDC